jgi:rubrerythrin
MLPPETLLALFVIALLAVLGGLVLLDELRARRIRSSRVPDHIFRCEQCSLVYTDDPEVERSRCPQCGRTNGVFNF